MKNTKMNMIVWGALLTLVVGCGGNDGYKKLVAGPMPEMGNWDGVYHSEAFGRMELSVNGETVIGLFEGDRTHGKIEGVQEGDLLNFKWTQWNEDLNGKSRETTGHGYFRYVVREEGTTEKARPVAYAEGEWGYLEANSGYEWKAVRFPDGTKKILTMDGQKASAAAIENANPFDSNTSSAPAPAPADTNFGSSSGSQDNGEGLF